MKIRLSVDWPTTLALNRRREKLMEIRARRWLAAWYRCPTCGAQTAQTRMTPTKAHRAYIPECYGWQCDCHMEIVEQKYYTTFAIEDGVGLTTVAGTLAALGAFKVCDYVFPNIVVFRRFVERRQAELAKEAQEYFERTRVIEAESKARREKQQKEEALVKEA